MELMPIEVKNADVIVTVVKERLERAIERLEGAMQDEVTRMVQRTTAGVDVNGQKFAPYTPAYNARKAKLRSGFITRTGKKGRNAKLVKGEFSAVPQPVDLTLSGNMLAAIQVKVDRTATGAVGTAYFNSALEAAKAQGNMKKRLFFGFSDEQVQRLKGKIV